MGASQSSGWRSSPQWGPPYQWNGQPQYYAPRAPGLTLTLGGKRKKTRRNNKKNKNTRSKRR